MDFIRKASLAAAVLCSAGTANAAGPVDDINQLSAIVRSKTTSVRRLPAAGMMLIEADGAQYITSDNGRIVISGGRVFDMWNGVEIKDTSDVDKYANKLDLAGIGLQIGDLAPLEIGSGKKTVVMFVDPNCPHCHRMMAQAAKIASDYRFQFILLPMLGPESIEKAKRAICATDKQAAAKALIDNSLAKLPAPDPSCSLVPLQKALVTAKVLGVDSVPFIIAPDGTMQRGAPKELGEWLSSLDVNTKSLAVVDKHTKTRNNNRSVK